jgi:peptidyl-prolyl cis-trans isomerase SurA
MRLPRHIVFTIAAMAATPWLLSAPAHAQGFVLVPGPGGFPPLAAAAPPPPAAVTPPAPKPKPKVAAKPAAPSAPAVPAKSIVALVNDEPVTGFEVDQRARMAALQANVGAKAQESFKQLIQRESTNQQLRSILEDTIAKNQGKTREQIIAIFEERKKQFALGLQKQALEGARASMVPQFRKQAIEELIEERLKLQEARKAGVEMSDEDTARIIKGIAAQNKMTEQQFAEHIKGLGGDVNTMKARFAANIAWREVIRRRFAAQISVNQRDVEKLLATTTSGEDTVELQVQRITLSIPGTLDQTALVKRNAEADQMRRRFSGCKSIPAVTQGMTNTKVDTLNYIAPSSVPEPTRTMMLSAKDGEMLPPTASTNGVEVFVVCGRRAIKADDKKREKATEELQQQEFEVMAKKHLRDIKQDAHIEYR